MSGSISWYEIPVTDLARATAFYNTILDTQLIPMEVSAGYPMAMFPAESGSTGCLIQGAGYTPAGQNGCKLYLNAGDDLQHVLDRVKAAGGSIDSPKTSIGENGFVSFIVDTEGNQVGLHSMG
jgi:predicted enzyme related to lactoylglutathione lyase